MKFKKNEKEINDYIKTIRETISNIMDAETKSEREHLVEDAIDYLDELEGEVSNHFDDVIELENDWYDMTETIDNVVSEAKKLESIINKY